VILHTQAPRAVLNWKSSFPMVCILHLRISPSPFQSSANYCRTVARSLKLTISMVVCKYPQFCGNMKQLSEDFDAPDSFGLTNMEASRAQKSMLILILSSSTTSWVCLGVCTDGSRIVRGTHRLTVELLVAVPHISSPQRNSATMSCYSFYFIRNISINISSSSA